jgi:hypothetical protein
MSDTRETKLNALRDAVNNEKVIHAVIADIMGKLNRSNLLPADGVKHAVALANAYKALQEVNVYECLKAFEKENKRTLTGSGSGEVRNQ